MKNNKWIVYCHTCPNGKRYFGVTSYSPNIRWRNGQGYKNAPFHNAISKYGWDNIKHEVLFENLTKGDAEQKEVELIRRYQTLMSENGYNCATGGGVNSGFKMSDEAKEKLRIAQTGRKHSEEAKKRMSESRKGEKAYWYGKKLSDETKEKIRNGKIGENNPNFGKRIRSEDYLKALSERMTGKNHPMYGKSELFLGDKNPMYGKKHSEETIKKYSEDRAGIKNPRSRKVCQFDKEGNLIKIWDYINQAVECLGLKSKDNIISCCRGRQKTAYGFVWGYYE